MFTLTVAQERGKVQKNVSHRSTAGPVGRAPTPSSTVTSKKKNNVNANITINTSISTGGNNKITAPIKGGISDQRELDIITAGIEEPPEVPKAGLVREKLLSEAQQAVTDSIDGKKAVSIVVIGELSFSVSCNDGVDLVFRSCGCRKIDIDGKTIVRAGKT